MQCSVGALQEIQDILFYCSFCKLTCTCVGVCVTVPHSHNIICFVDRINAWNSLIQDQFQAITLAKTI